MRIHPLRGARESLNTTGMLFSELPDTPLTRPIFDQEWSIFSLYNTLSELGNLAIAYEQAELTTPGGIP
jgi:hypothetical protein